MCGSFSALHWGQVVVPTAVAFQFARRERVLERDIFRFGTATSGPSLCLGGGLGESRERRPSGVDHVMVVVRVLGERQAALRAQTQAVGPAHRLERQRRHHRVPEHRLEVDQTVLDQALLLCVLIPDLAVVGTEAEVDAHLERFVEAGMTELCANIVGSREDTARTMAHLARRRSRS